MPRYNKCPRCDDAKIEKASDSPTPGVWEVWRCQRCNYVWRTTEDLTGIQKHEPRLVDRASNFWPVEK